MTRMRMHMQGGGCRVGRARTGATMQPPAAGSQRCRADRALLAQRLGGPGQQQPPQQPARPSGKILFLTYDQHICVCLLSILRVLGRIRFCLVMRCAERCCQHA